jgi:hypothetical protein
MASAKSNKANVGQNSRGSRYTQAKTPEEYLDQRLDKSESCWVFTGGRDKDGYGQVQASRVARDNGVTRAHQLAYVAWVGPIEAGMFVCHSCDKPSCCNPEHLFLGTPLDNVQDMWSKDRWVPGVKPKLDYPAIVALHGVKPCEVVAKEFNCSFSAVCKIWRKHGLKGRNFYAIS